MSETNIKKQNISKFFIRYNEELKDDADKLFNFRTFGCRLKSSISNYEYWAENEYLFEAIDSMKMILKSYYELKEMGIDVPKLSSICKYTTYYKKAIDGSIAKIRYV